MKELITGKRVNGLTVLYRSYNQLYKSFVFGYEKDNPSDEYFKTKILEQESSAADKYPETLYTANLMFAKNISKINLSP